MENLSRFLPAGRLTQKEALASTIAIDNCNCECHSTFDEVDKLLEAVPDLTNADFRAWYCKAIYQLGCQEFLDLADQARTGKNPPRLFSALLKTKISGRL